MQLPGFDSYGQYSSSNYGVNALKFWVGNYVVYFSYRTPVAFSGPSTDYNLVVSVNEWGPTTGKHLNWIDGGDKKSRIDRKEFERLLAKATK